MSCIKAIFSSSRLGHLDVAQRLCEAGADTDKAGPDGAAPLRVALESGHLGVARLLREAGADEADSDG